MHQIIHKLLPVNRNKLLYNPQPHIWYYQNLFHNVHLLNSVLYTFFSLSDFLYTAGMIYVSSFTTLMQTSTVLIIPPEVTASASALLTKYMDVNTALKSPTKSRVSLKGKIVKVIDYINTKFSYNLHDRLQNSGKKIFVMYMPGLNVTGIALCPIIYMLKPLIVAMCSIFYRCIFLNLISVYGPIVCN